MRKPGISLISITTTTCVWFLLSSFLFFCTGDHIRDVGYIYGHHMLVVQVIDSSRLIVIHYTGGAEGFLAELFRDSRFSHGTIKEEEIEINLTEQTIHLLGYPEGDALYTGMDAVVRARTKLKEEKYNILWNNCESFVNWAITDKNQTNQGDRATVATVVVGIALGVAAVGMAAFGIWTVSQGGQKRKK